MAQINEQRSAPDSPRGGTRIVAAAAKLAEEPLPHGSEKLTGSEHTYRIRVGDYRVVYRASPQRENCENSTRAASERRLQVAQIANSQRSTP